MTDPQRTDKSRPESDKGKPQPDGNASAADGSESATPKELTPEEQMALYEKDLKENDWGHQPC